MIDSELRLGILEIFAEAQHQDFGELPICAQVERLGMAWGCGLTRQRRQMSEEVRLHVARWDRENKDLKLMRYRKWYRRHREERTAQSRAYYLRHREKILLARRDRA